MYDIFRGGGRFRYDLAFAGQLNLARQREPVLLCQVPLGCALRLPQACRSQRGVIPSCQSVAGLSRASVPLCARPPAALKKPKSKGAKGTSIFKKKAIEKSLVRSVEQMMAGKIAQTGGGFTMPEFRALGKEQVAKLAKERELQAAKTKRIKGEDRDVRRAERVLQQAAAADEKRVA